MRNRTRTLAALAAAGALLAGACGSDDAASVGAAAEDPAERVKIGIFEITNAAVLDDISAGFVAGFTDETGLDRDRIEIVEENAQGDPSLIQSIARSFAEGDTDMVAVVGTPAVIAQAEQITDRPVIAMAMGDPVGAGVAESLDAPGGNVTGSIDYIDPALLVDEIRQVHPELASIGTVHDPANQNMQVWMDDLRAAADERGLEIVEAAAAASTDIDAAARSLDGRVDVILTGPDTMVIEAIGVIGQVARRGGVPLYTVGADVTVEGVLASLGPDYAAVGRLAGIAAADVFAGTPAGEVPFGRPGELTWELDEAEAERLGLSIPADLLGATG